MNPTSFLAQLWAPTLLAVALGIFVSRKYYLKTYRDLQKETLAVFLFGIVAISAGMAHINYHNSWTTFPEGVISFLGWGLLAKGLIFAIAPGFVDKAGDFEADSKLIPVAGALTLIVGTYLAWVGFFM